MGRETGNLQALREDAGCSNAVVFIHGFTGDRDDTWDRLPGMLGTHVSDWNIYTLGYATTLLPDITGIWSADPDLPIVALSLRTQMGMEPLSHYGSLALVAHSMGGLAVQRALVDDATLAGRVKHAIFFGTPSGGLKKASWFGFWKRQLMNMAKEGGFITSLRDDWRRKFGAKPPFALLAVAGSKDQFVPPESSLQPFPAEFQRVVSGDHLSMVKPADSKAECVRLLLSTLNGTHAPRETIDPLRVAAETPLPGILRTIQDRGDAMVEPQQVVDAALALERLGKRDQAIALLDRHRGRGSDIQGTLGGRIKRLWLEDGSTDHAKYSLRLYQDALATAQGKADSAQIYYGAINIAFLKFVAFDEQTEAREMANLALFHCALAEKELWNTATQAEANLYLGNKELALQLYGQLMEKNGKPWQLASSSQQAARIAAKLQDRDLLEKLEAIFTPGARKISKIFLSYSHKDKDSMERLQVHLAPYLRQAETELELWVDTGIMPGDDWNARITEALRTCGVAVVMVSADFLASKYVMARELPEIAAAAKDGDMRLLWIHLSHAGYEETPLKDFQAAHDIAMPLKDLSEAARERAFKEIAMKIKQAALGATSRFTAVPPTGIKTGTAA